MKTIQIALIAYHLEIGGLERVVLEIFKMFQKTDEVQIRLVLLENKIGFDVSDIKDFYQKSFILKEEKSVVSKALKYVKLKRYFQENKFDYILDFRYRVNPYMEFLFTHYIYNKQKVIYTVHSSRIEEYGFDASFLSKYNFKKAWRIVTVSKGIQDKIEEKCFLKNIRTIHNPITFKNGTLKETEPTKKRTSYILYSGRFSKDKQVDLLLKAYAQSVLPSLSIDLVLVGDGEAKLECATLANQLKITEKVFFEGFVTNIDAFYKDAIFTVLTSKEEGFGMVLAESLSFGTPVISFDMPFGPSEIIQNEINGLLVPNQNFEELVKALNRMALDVDLLSFCQKNAIKSIERFSTEKIKEEWFNLLEIR